MFPMDLKELKAQIRRLPPEERANLARDILESLDVANESEIERLWVDEAMRRDDALDQGLDEAYPVKDVLSRARARRK